MRLASLLGTALGGLLMALPPGLAAADVALVLANEDYEALPPLPDGDAPARATGGIEALGFDVASLADGGREDASRALARFMAGVPEAERLLVVLSGRFATDGTRSWFLSADSPVPTLFGLNSNAVSLESVLAVLARRPSRAVLVLGVEPEAQGPFDPWLSEGLGELDVPQGVTVLGSTPRAVAAFMADELSEPGGDLAALVTANPAIRSDGYLPQGFAFMPEIPEAPTPREPQGPSAAERALWEGAVALDTVEAFRDYLRRYPQGSYAPEARAAVAAILAEPNRAARLEEEALRLGRDERRQVQADLAALDFDPRGLDGVFGPGTRAAITNWQQENGFPPTSYLDAEQVERLADQAAEREAVEEAQRRVAARADDEFWERTGADGDIEGLRAYLERFPDGRHAEEAADRVALLEAAVRAAAEDQAWERAREDGRIGAFDRFLETWPDGRHADEAREARRAALVEAEAEARAEAQREAAREGEAALGLTPLTARVIEARLRAMDFDPGEVDGEIDRDTRSAIRGYQGERGLAATGFLDEDTVVRLLADTLGQRLED